MSLEENVGSNTYRYGSRIKFLEGGEYGYTIRVVPNNPHLINRFEQGLVKWVVQ
jgi:starch phosphorylase